MQYSGIFASSSDPTGQTLSQTVQGVVAVLSAVVPLVALQFFHVQVTASDVSSLVSEAGIVIGAILTIRGLILKVINSTATKPSA